MGGRKMSKRGRGAGASTRMDEARASGNPGKESRISTRPTSRKGLPEKVCPVCNRPFTWRKKWARDWENVKYCSERCRRTSKNSG